MELFLVYIKFVTLFSLAVFSHQFWCSSVCPHDQGIFLLAHGHIWTCFRTWDWHSVRTANGLCKSCKYSGFNCTLTQIVCKSCKANEFSPRSVVQHVVVWNNVICISEIVLSVLDSARIYKYLPFVYVQDTYGYRI